MTTAESVVVRDFGDYDCLEIREFPLPPLEGKIEVDVHYGGLNFADIYTRLGLFPKEVPFVLGNECSGIITQLGFKSNGCNLKVGDRVICFDHRGGLFSKTVRVEPRHCFKIPDDVPLKEAAAIFVSYVTAYLSLFDLGNLRPNQYIFVKSCAGGVGTAAAQLASTVENVGICGTVSNEAKVEFAATNGVRFVYIDGFVDKVREEVPGGGVDVFIENQSGADIALALDQLRPLGKLVVIGANSLIENERHIGLVAKLKLWWYTFRFSLKSLVVNSRSVCGLHLGNLVETEPLKIRRTLDEIFKLWREGKITPRIDAVWPMSQVVDGTKLLAERKNLGKVLIRMKRNDELQIFEKKNSQQKNGDGSESPEKHGEAVESSERSGVEVNGFQQNGNGLENNGHESENSEQNNS